MRNEGVPPREINDSLNQAKIKEAVSSTNISGEQNYEMDGMQSSISDQIQEQTIPEDSYPSPQLATEEGGEQYYSQSPQAYYEESSTSQGFDAESITEISEQIAEQIVLEKFNEFTEKTGDLTIFKQEINDKMGELDRRLKRIEDSMDKLQSAVIQRIGDFGENTEYIKKDLENLHSLTSKLMNPLIDNYQALKEMIRQKDEFSSSKQEKQNEKRFKKLPSE